MEANKDRSSDLLQLTAEIVAAYVGNNRIDRAELPSLVAFVMDGLRHAPSPSVTPPAGTPPPVPAVPIKRSISGDFVICLEDGKKFKSLKRHLSIHYGMSPNEYRKKWNLPHDYPMVAPAYAATRSALTYASGLGRKRDVPAAEPTDAALGKRSAAPVRRRTQRKAKEEA